MSCVDVQPCVDWANDTAENCRVEESRGPCDTYYQEWRCFDLRECSWNTILECIGGFFCAVGRYVSTGVCRIYETIKTTVCEGTTAAAKGACQLFSTTVNAVCDFFVWVWELTTAALGCIFSKPTSRNIIEDIVPNFEGINFTGRDERNTEIPFLWGVSTASFQAEGQINNSDWSIFSRTPNIQDRVEGLPNFFGDTTFRLEPPQHAVHHRCIDVLKQDLDRVELLGMNTYRFSLEWSRIQPMKPAWAETYITTRLSGGDYSGLSTNGYNPNEFNDSAIEFYREMIDEMKERGLTIVLTLNHMSLPDWVLTPPKTPFVTIEDDYFKNSLRGWESEIVIEAYKNFVERVVFEFIDKVDYWITLNEPIATQMQLGYIAGIFPPGFSLDGDRAKKVYFNLIRAHVAAYDTIKQIAQNSGVNAKVGFSQYVAYAQTAPQRCIEKKIGDNDAARDQWDYAINRYFLDAVINGIFNDDLLLNNDFKPVIPQWVNKLDFIAPQYYRSFDIYHDLAINSISPWIRGGFHADVRGRTDYLSNKLFNDLGWTIYPGGLYQILKDFHDRYNLPILITENGICQRDDRNRAAYTISHLQQVLRAIKDGVNILGYIHWSIVDNYEWAYGYQNAGRFGLFTVDRDVSIANECESYPRHITEGALCYQYVIAKSMQLSRANNNENPFDLPVKRFGTIDAEGLRIEPPDMSFGGLWKISAIGDNRTLFNLYLTRLSTIQWQDIPDTDWVGMIFFLDIAKWVRLENIQWSGGVGESSSNGILTFRHPSILNQRVFSEYTFATFPTSAQRQLDGTITTGSQIRNVIGIKERKMGTWKKNNVGPDFITLHYLEGDKDRWHGKYLNSKPEWDSFVVDISLFDLTSHSTGEDSIHGTFTTATGVVTFGGTKLPDGILF